MGKLVFRVKAVAWRGNGGAWGFPEALYDAECVQRDKFAEPHIDILKNNKIKSTLGYFIFNPIAAISIVYVYIHIYFPQSFIFCSE